MKVQRKTKKQEKTIGHPGFYEARVKQCF